ncbi:MAG: hypothetical protein ACREET_18860 [Stellaceae bacterium]
MSDDLYIGPLLERDGKYSYDAFSAAKGMKSSFGYRCVGEARYDQRALLAEAARDPRCNLRICETLGEFEKAVAAARRPRSIESGSRH